MGIRDLNIRKALGVGPSMHYLMEGSCWLLSHIWPADASCLLPVLSKVHFQWACFLLPTPASCTTGKPASPDAARGASDFPWSVLLPAHLSFTGEETDTPKESSLGLLPHPSFCPHPSCWLSLYLLGLGITPVVVVQLVYCTRPLSLSANRN